MIVALPDTSSLLKPLTDQDVLVPDEELFYAERQHWAAIVQPMYETFLVLLLTIFVFDASRFGVVPANSWILFILIPAAIHMFLLIITGSRPPTSRLAVDPFSSTGPSGANPIIWWSIGLLLLLVLVALDTTLTVLFAIVVIIGRLVTIIARWTFYERRYVTNRRLIESSGFLGSRISSMPLTRVTDVVYGRTVPGEFFDYARMRVETAGQDQALGVVRFISEPNSFYEVLTAFSAPTAGVTPKRPPRKSPGAARAARQAGFPTDR